MIDIQQKIKSNNTTKIQGWINSLDPLFLSDASINDLLFIAEKLNSKAFSKKPINMDFARLLIDLYEKMYSLDTSKESKLMSAIYIRLKVIREAEKAELDPFFSPEIIIDLVRQKFIAPFDEIRDQITKWQTLDINQIKKLRSFKNWLTVLEVLEENQNTEYKEFDNWKSIRHMLP